MKWRILTAALLLISGSAHAIMTQPTVSDRAAPAPASYLSSLPQTEIIQWGCPVEEAVLAASEQEAIDLVAQDCVKNATQAANNRPHVIEVFENALNEPHLDVYQEEGRYIIRGIFYIQTSALLLSKAQ